MKNEQIIKIGRLVYAKLFDVSGVVYNSNFIYFQDKKGEYDCTQLFWRFYWITDLDKDQPMPDKMTKEEARKILTSVTSPAYEACYKLLEQLSEIHNEKVAQATDAFKVISDLAFESYEKKCEEIDKQKD